MGPRPAWLTGAGFRLRQTSRLRGCGSAGVLAWICGRGCRLSHQPGGCCALHSICWGSPRPALSPSDLLCVECWLEGLSCRRASLLKRWKRGGTVGWWRPSEVGMGSPSEQRGAAALLVCAADTAAVSWEGGRGWSPESLVPSHQACPAPGPRLRFPQPLVRPRLSRMRE